MMVFKHIQKIWDNISLGLRRKLVLIMLSLIFFNLLIFIFGFFASKYHPVILGLLTLAYGLGLRHAVDADHIAAIDNTTRKLMLDGKKSVSIGLFFSLGHSTIVIILSVLVALSSVFIKNSLPSLQANGTIIGTSVSSFFLLLIGFINLIAFLDILRVFRHVTKEKNYKHKVEHDDPYSHGFFTRIFKPLLKIVHSSWQMYFIGLLFGLGFDTASEVGLLSISAASGASGISIWEILLLPLAFTAGMALIDTLDGILMLGAYGWAYIKPVRKLYYNLNITFISVIIALFIGGIEAVQLISFQFKLHGKIFQMLSYIDLSKLGYIIILTFILSWLVSIGIYKIKGYDQLI